LVLGTIPVSCCMIGGFKQRIAYFMTRDVESYCSVHLVLAEYVAVEVRVVDVCITQHHFK
jgi:hypothetical protein